MYGREARDITVVAPLLNGVVSTSNGRAAMLAHFVRERAVASRSSCRRALMSVDPVVTQVERRALLEVANTRISDAC